MSRKKDRWPELCKAVSKDDGLPTRIVGHWTEKKLFFWNRYIEITTSAMVGHSQWQAGLVYVDLFAGPGICTLRESKIRIPGSPLIAANAVKPFERILFVKKISHLQMHAKSESQEHRQKNAASFLMGIVIY